MLFLSCSLSDVSGVVGTSVRKSVNGALEDGGLYSFSKARYATSSENRKFMVLQETSGL